MEQHYGLRRHTRTCGADSSSQLGSDSSTCQYRADSGKAQTRSRRVRARARARITAHQVNFGNDNEGSRAMIVN